MKAQGNFEPRHGARRSERTPAARTGWRTQAVWSSRGLSDDATDASMGQPHPAVMAPVSGPARWSKYAGVIGLAVLLGLSVLPAHAGGLSKDLQDSINNGLDKKALKRVVVQFDAEN